MNAYITIFHGTETFVPNVVEGVTWDLSRRLSPGKLTFSVLRDEKMQITEGDAVSLKVDDTYLFYGYVFTRKYSKNGIIDITAYDQLRYLKNKDSFSYENMTASQVVKLIFEAYKLKMGYITNTQYVIPMRTEDNSTLFDIIGNAMDLELIHKGNMLVLYDDYGKLTLKNIEEMSVNVAFDSETVKKADFSVSIDSETYNQVKLIRDGKNGKREIFFAESTENINKWGCLQYHDKVAEGENGQAKAEQYLSAYNNKTQSLKLSGVFGDLAVRAGSIVYVDFTFDEVVIPEKMVVEQCRHSFKNDEHTTDLTLKGCDIYS